MTYRLLIQETPNPLARRISIDPPLFTQEMAGYDFPNRDSAKTSPLIENIFALEQVQSAFMGKDFITIVLNNAIAWDLLKTIVIEVISHYLASGKPIINNKIDHLPSQISENETPNIVYEGNDKEIVDQIITLIDEKIRPSVALDGGDIKFFKWDVKTNTVFLSMHGACASCPSAIYTLKAGVEKLIKYYVPEVAQVEAI